MASSRWAISNRKKTQESRTFVSSFCSRLPESSSPLDSDSPHFANWCKALSIGSLEIRISLPKGWSSSRIRKMAPETARAETTKAKIVVAFGGASTLKPRKITTSQETRMISIGSEMEGTTCATSSDRSWPRSVAMVVASQRSVTPPKTTFPKLASYYLPDRLPHEQRVTTCVVVALRFGW